MNMPVSIAQRKQRTAYLGLGSNLGDRRGNLQRALGMLQGAGLDLVRTSSIYESDPVGPVVEQPPFLNAVVQVVTYLEPMSLLRLCQGVESAMGRVRRVIKGPRIIDVDLLLVEDLVLDMPELRLPHPELRNRAFVLVPLAELTPLLLDPRDQTLLSCALGTVMRDQSILKVGGPQAWTCVDPEMSFVQMKPRSRREAI